MGATAAPRNKMGESLWLSDTTSHCAADATTVVVLIDASKKTDALMTRRVGFDNELLALSTRDKSIVMRILIRFVYLIFTRDVYTACFVAEFAVYSDILKAQVCA